MKKFFFLILCAISLIACKPDRFLKEEGSYLYYMRYDLNGDSTIMKFHKPISYTGIVSNRSCGSHFVGVPGKGGHTVTNYKVVVKYNSKVHTFHDSKTYHSFRKNEEVIITEVFYPRFNVHIRHK